MSLAIGEELFDLRHELINNTSSPFKNEDLTHEQQLAQKALPPQSAVVDFDTNYCILKSSIEQRVFVKPTVKATKHCQIYQKHL
mmetsp:Transcript_4824/g.8276  ORF Transcript_4824/g.8276 Transcript_4824/m.8276 type:complete len:84 (+) Transcript_4824:531-782(+)